MALVRWDPFRELTLLQGEVNRMFGRISGGAEVPARESWVPSVDVVESDGSVKLKADLAGMRPEDIQIEVEDNVLTVSGERRFEESVNEDRYYRIERRYGSFSRSIALPQGVQTDMIDASYDNGVLEITVPKAEEEKPKKITIGIKSESSVVEGSGAEAPPEEVTSEAQPEEATGSGGQEP